MTKEYKRVLLLSASVMIAVPLIINLIFSIPATSGWGMVTTLFLFFVVDPFFSAWLGKFCSNSVKRYWSFPLVNAAFFMVGVWLAFDFGNTDFMVYAAAYFVIGYAVMGIFSIFKHKKV